MSKLHHAPVRPPVVAIVPAAGKGSRLAPFPCPKELFPVGYQDYLIQGKMEKRPKVVSHYLLDNLIQAGVKRIFLIVGDDKWDIMTYYGNGSDFGVDIAYLFQQRLDGMPSAINLATPWMQDEVVLFGMPDTIIEPHDAFSQLLEYHLHEQADLTLGLFATDTPEKFGMVEMDGDNNVIFTVDKPKQSALQTMWGNACWSPSFSQLLSGYLQANPYLGKELVLGDVFNLALEKGMRVKGLLFAEGRYLDIGTTHELDVAIRRFHL
ncbi:Nucleotidyl transferase [Magnetococcus marinus MC-1]|uniref:glucose-1-phosphate thymidylyltransferase n=1 Tax=Magnetococcus marinus (strain ATCC BAA-1437 / JCM 17883 / MC-1) TaxID=156889 RepID=A0LAF2_MAGMM|nr:sugar phosphate nucleotidyltransferase [Magnetococcus marinus]ABK44945.1 Nucleotidyl transferase [Magnetococcus marinus MC-1]